MGRGQDYAWFNSAAGAFLEADVGSAEDDEECAGGVCDEPAAFRVPWPTAGGDVAYCRFHVARYREQHPDLIDRGDGTVYFSAGKP